MLAEATGGHLIRLVDAFYRAGSLVFGGVGHVVLPLLQATVVAPGGWARNRSALRRHAGNARTDLHLRRLPRRGGNARTERLARGAGGNGVDLRAVVPAGGRIAAVLGYAAPPNGVRAALRGVNAAVGVLLAALFTPIWTGAVHTSADFGLGLVAFLLLALWAVPPWVVVVLGAVPGRRWLNFGAPV